MKSASVQAHVHKYTPYSHTHTTSPLPTQWVMPKKADFLLAQRAAVYMEELSWGEGNQTPRWPFQSGKQKIHGPSCILPHCWRPPGILQFLPHPPIPLDSASFPMC